MFEISKAPQKYCTDSQTLFWKTYAAGGRFILSFYLGTKRIEDVFFENQNDVF